MMKYRTIGNTGIEVSVLCWGTDMLGGLVEQKEGEKILKTLRQQGINFIDTADAYQNGNSECLLGELIRDDRKRWILATKAGYPLPSDEKGPRLSRDRILKKFESSLERLGTEYVDIYYLHIIDPQTTIAETVRTMGEVVESGRARCWGFSNYYAWQIAEMIRICDLEGIPRPVIAQTHYNIFKRYPEREYLPACEHFDISVIGYSPLARGVLTGKYQPGTPPPTESRKSLETTFTMKAEYHPESLELAQKIKQHAETQKMGPVQFAVLWVIQNQIIASVIAGPRNVEQLLDYLKAFEHKFTEENERFVENLIPAGQEIPPNYVRRFLPVTGRRLK